MEVWTSIPPTRSTIDGEGLVSVLERENSLDAGVGLFVASRDQE